MMNLTAARGAARSIAFLVLVAPAHAVTSGQIDSTINAERQANGIPRVTEDPALSAGCAQ